MRRIVAAALFTALVQPAFAAAQNAPAPLPPAEHFGLGAYGAVGTSAIGALRLSLPLGQKAGLDVDVGQVRSRDEPNSSMGIQVRYLWRGRRATGGSGYFVIGVLRLHETHRILAGDGRRTWEIVERRTPTMPQVGYGWDWQHRRGTRLGLELTTGSEGEAGPRAFAKLFIVWGPPLRG